MCRPALFLLAFATALPLAVPAAAEPVATDPADDQATTIQGQEVDVDRWGAVDLLGLDMEESLEGFDFILAAADLEPDGETVPGLDAVELQVRFTYRGAQYVASIDRAPGLDSYYWYGWLEMIDPASGRHAAISALDIEVDPAADTLTFHVQRDWIAGADGTGLQRGSRLEAIHAIGRLRSSNSTLINSPVAVVPHPVASTDRMPDQGGVVWEVREGLQQSGHARLGSQAPVRVSNGEATTFLFELLASNDGSQQELFRLQALDPPPEWTVTFPQERLRIEAGKTLAVPMLVTVPFQHQHGTFLATVVEMQSQQDPGSVGRVQVGVRYTAVPQPSGHHDTLHVHVDRQRDPYLNTLEEDPGAGTEPGVSRSSCSCDGEQISRFYIPLLPGLQMGLDFDLERQGTAELDMSFGVDQEATVRGWISVVKPGQEYDSFRPDEREADVAVLVPVTHAFQGGQVDTLTFQIAPTTYGDYLPYTADARFLLTLDVVLPGTLPICCFDVSRPLLHGGMLRLPLDEYHDDVDEYFASLAGLEMYASGPQERLVNPGETVVFNVTLQNIGQAAGRFRLSLTGTEWARILGSHEVHVGAGQTRQLAVAVDAPADAADGMLADMSLHAVSARDDNARSLVRLLAVVDTDADHPDEARLAQQLEGKLQDRRSPGAWLGLLLLPLLARRRVRT